MSSPHPDPLADMLTKPHELDGKFESQAKTVTTCISDAALTSIAVSLKRIADALDGGDAAQGGRRRPPELPQSPLLSAAATYYFGDHD